MRKDHEHAHGAGLAATEQLSSLHDGCLAALGTDRDSGSDLIEPHKDEAPGLQAEGFEGQKEADSHDSEASKTADQAGDDGKRFATLRAQLALKGYGLQVLPGNGFLVTRWDRTLHCPDLAFVRSFHERLGDGA